MAKGKWHDRFNFVAGVLLTGALWGLGLYWGAIVSFVVGWLFSTLIFSPDTDIMPKKRASFLRFFLFPYSIIFKHRGQSHYILWGTITRVVYGILIVGIVVYFLHRAGHIQYAPERYWPALFYFFANYQYGQWEYLIVTWLFVGMVGADLLHLFVDFLSDCLKKIWNFLR